MSTDRAAKKANDLRLLNERRSDLQKLADKYGPALATKPHPRFAGKSLRDSVDYALERGSLTVVRETLASIRRYEENKELEVQASGATDSYIVAYGKTYGLNDKFHQYGFTLKKFGNTWAWFREILADKAWYWEQTVRAIGPGIEAVFIRDFDRIESALVESKVIDREVKASEPREEMGPHKLDGAVFEVSRWYSLKFKENNNTAYAFRNLKILKVKGESDRAYLVDAEFFSGIASTCGICGQELNNDISRATGIGPICGKKIGLPRPTMANAKLIVADLEARSKAQGVFKDVWVPKSQIKNIIDTQGNQNKQEVAETNE